MDSELEGCTATGLEIRNCHSGPTSTKCPNCGLEFASNLAVVDHLNDQMHSCWNREPTYRLPIPPAFQRGDNNREEVTGQYHPNNKSIVPFVDQAEWQLAEFLVQRLTQTDINKFLKLDWAKREYGEFFTANMAFDIQNDLPEGATMVPIILASDKTPCNQDVGGLEMHPVFLTIANIQSEVRMNATAHAWRCVAFIPIPKFDVHADFQTLLHARLFHKCMDMIFAKCKDSMGYIQHCFTPLVAYTADLPEAQLIACVSKNASPLTMATQSDFGNHTLKLIYDLCKRVDPWNVPLFQHEVKALLLSGVHQPYWRDWPHADPSHFLPGELLHTCHKYFGDHPLNKHNPRFVHAIHFLTEFIYQAQSPVHTDSSIDAMVHSLHMFHTLKQAILDAGARRGKSGTIDNFLIPKMELFHSFAGSIRDLGGLIQYSVDVRLVRQARNFTLQVVQILNRDETMRRFNLYTLLHSHGTPLRECHHNRRQHRHGDRSYFGLDSACASREQNRFHGPQLVRNHFLKGILSVEANATFHVTISPDRKSLPITDLQSIYSPPRFWRRHGTSFSLQLHSTFQSRVVMPSQIVQAYIHCASALCFSSYCQERLAPSYMFSTFRSQQHLLRMQALACQIFQPGSIIPLTAVTCAVELIPMYGSKMDRTINAANAMEICDEYYLNTFSDKEVFNTMHSGLM
ncbi:hypothetical protein DFJ58DRAFT_716523 [Suillus subalutaceus]|uniref:uncharacterized protein n=1 Tax=Suillus subalutaceus TaxID=48586 RepID=UPI001B87FF00|nr:uncharacterized protein DFJ58DRAFT_716523 [Suillus subalutaceus]KAG1853181.1 hypothetical protein DFJ58DRAFT_716523 [Suillus subalutaceus]